MLEVPAGLIDRVAPFSEADETLVVLRDESDPEHLYPIGISRCHLHRDRALDLGVGGRSEHQLPVRVGRRDRGAVDVVGLCRGLDLRGPNPSVVP